MDELEEFLATGRSRPSAAASAPKPDPLSDELRRDFAILRSSPDDSLDKIRKAYKHLLRDYHPDRHFGDPEKQRIATEVTQKLNASYRRVRRYKENQTAGR